MAAADRPAKPRRPGSPPKPWQRAEAGRYRSADERFTLENEGAGRWFLTDGVERDELGLPRTTGPYPTLEAAKAAADAARSGPVKPSPLADRLAEAGARPRSARARGSGGSDTHRSGAASARPDAPARQAEQAATPAPAAPPPTWLDTLAARDGEAARGARQWITALEWEGIADAAAIVRRDVLGDRPAVATRLLARDVLAALGALPEATTIAVARAVAGVLASAPERHGLPGWELRERDRHGRPGRAIRLTAEDLLAAAGPADPPDAEGQ